MMQSEFESYKKIEKVYVYYPGVKDKQHIVQIYNDFGMVIIEDLLIRAEKIEILKNKIQTREAALEKLK